MQRLGDITDAVYSVDTGFNDFLYRAVFGQPAPDQVQQIANDTYNKMLKAGGTQAQAQAAANQASGVATAGGASSSTLWLLGAAAVGAIILIKVL